MNSFSFRSYFKFLGRNKGYTAINLVGFSISLMFAILLGLYVRQEMGVDKFHQDKERVFRMTNDMGNGFGFPIADDLLGRYPEIESITRVMENTPTITVATQKTQASTYYVDSTFFSIFSFPLIEGNPSEVFKAKQNIVLTRQFATRLFGDREALGQTIAIDTLTYVVSGIAEDFENSHLRNPDMLMRTDNLHRFYFAYDNAGAFVLYVKTKPEADFGARMPDVEEWFKTFYWPYQEKYSYASKVGVEPIEDVYFSPLATPRGPVRSNSSGFILVLLAAALAILLFAVINYINLSVAQSGFRAKEAAVRRLLGGSRGALFLNFVFESILFCFGAMILAVVMAVWFEPVFNRLLETRIDVIGNLNLSYLLILLLCPIVLGTIAGLLPASVLSRFKPIDIVRGTFRRRTKMVYSRIFICFQYTITIVLLGATLTVMRQTQYMRTTDLGFDKENIIYMETMTGGKRNAALRDRLMQVNGVEAVSFSRGTPLNAGNNNTVDYDDRPAVSFQVFEIDSVFWDIFGLELIRETGNDTGIWINEETARILDLPDNATEVPIGSRKEPLLGVVKNFHIRELDQAIEPMMLRKMKDNAQSWDIVVKISGMNPGEIYHEVVNAYLDFNGGEPFESGFVDQEINKWYDEQERTYTIIGYFSTLAILISALGLFAMATYFMRQRAMEVAVRKVFGAENREILERLVFSFLKIVGVSFIIAIPIIWYSMSEWLKSYAYHISLSWTVFALAGIIAFAIAFAAVFWQSYRATTANPIDSLKNQ